MDERSGQPEIGEEWIYSDEEQTDGREVRITITNLSNESVIMSRIQDEDFLREQVRLIERTYQKNGQDLDNAEEVVPFAKYNSDTGEFEPDPIKIFYGAREFHNMCQES